MTQPGEWTEKNEMMKHTKETLYELPFPIT